VTNIPRIKRKPGEQHHVDGSLQVELAELTTVNVRTSSASVVWGVGISPIFDVTFILPMEESMGGLINQLS